jgi:uncharacterized protein YyaL (SSP411 family)
MTIDFSNESLASSITLSLNWLSHSHIRCANGDSNTQGGLYQGYDWENRSYPFIYSEITGYAISIFLNAYHWTEEATYLKLAKEAADFIIRIKSTVEDDQHQGAVPLGYSLAEGRILNQFNSFDAAMCLQGLLDLYTVQPSSDLSGAARSIGNWLVGKMQHGDGAFYSRYDMDTGVLQHPGSNFFDDFGCLHAKHVIGLLKLHRICDESQLLEAVWRVCNWVLSLQDRDGAFPASKFQPTVVSHPMCYAVEGLLYAHAVLGEDRFLRAGINAGSWLIDHQGKDGSIQIGYERRWWRPDRMIRQSLKPARVTDATSQAIRIWLILYYLTGQSNYLAASEQAASFLLSMQSVETFDPDQLGGFFFQPGHPMQFTWSTMFAVHALYALKEVHRHNAYQKMIEELF